MPLYDYECSCGKKFEAIRPIGLRHTADCECGKMGEIRMSSCQPSRVLIAGWDTVVGHDGRILSRKQSTDTIPMLPEKVHGSRF